VPEERYTAEEVDAAVEALSREGRFTHAQEIVSHAAPGLQRILGEVLQGEGWFASAQDSRLRAIAGEQDEGERLRVAQELAVEEARLGMLVGVAVGLELAEELRKGRSQG
jgi:hypothetical protein